MGREERSPPLPPGKDGLPFATGLKFEGEALFYVIRARGCVAQFTRRKAFCGPCRVTGERLSDGRRRNAMRWSDSGDQVTHRLNPVDNETAIASWLAKRVYRMLRGETTPTAAGFNRRLNYPKSGLA